MIGVDPGTGNIVVDRAAAEPGLRQADRRRRAAPRPLRRRLARRLPVKRPARPWPSPSPSSDGRTSGNRPSSTGWSAGGWRWSHDLPGVTRDRREAEASYRRPRLPADRHGRPRGGRRRRRLQGRMRRQTEGGDRRSRPRALRDRRARRASRPPTSILPKCVRDLGQAGGARRQQGGGPGGGERHAGGLFARLRRAGRGLRRARHRHAGRLRRDPRRRCRRRREPRRRASEEGAEAGGEEKPLHLAIIGQPNAGKSTLVNRLIGEERMLTGPEAGITRDAIAVDWSWRGRTVPPRRHGRHPPQGEGGRRSSKSSRSATRCG